MKLDTGAPPGVGDAAALSALEQAIGTPLGCDGAVAEIVPCRRESPWEALVEGFVSLLERPPVLLAFSGGRDSSLLLAAAVECAQRHGLTPAIPTTYRNAGAPGMQEDAWQELAIKRLDVRDWERIDGLAELDFLGPVARAALMHHGVRYTPNAHFVVPLASRARGGTLVLGLGGDELLAGWRWTERADVLARRIPPGRSSLGTVLLGSAPRAARRMLFARRISSLDAPWLTDVARRMLPAAAAEQEDQPVRWDRFVTWSLRRRRLTVTLDTLASLARDAGAELSLPLLDRRFLAALAGAGGAYGWSGRTAAMSAIAAGHLAPETIERRSKAHFDEVYWGPESRSFAREWSGTLVPPELVDGERLRREWLSERPRSRSAMLLQAAWLRENLIKNTDGHGYAATQRH
jgi:asparagine synthetase B (glutamine-hydrolysing)